MAVDDGLLDTNGSISNKIHAHAKNSALPSGKRAAPTQERKDPDCEQVTDACGSRERSAPSRFSPFSIMSLYYFHHQEKSNVWTTCPKRI